MVGSQEACSANESNASMDEALDAKVVSNDVQEKFANGIYKRVPNPNPKYRKYADRLMENNVYCNRWVCKHCDEIFHCSHPSILAEHLLSIHNQHIVTSEEEIKEMQNEIRYSMPPDLIKKPWSHEDKMTLITMAEKYDVLWNSSYPFYRELTQRKKALEDIKQHLSDSHNVEDINSQWRNLKDVFYKKKGMMENRRAKGEVVGEPLWRYYQPLKFLLACEEERKNILRKRFRGNYEMSHLRQWRIKRKEDLMNKIHANSGHSSKMGLRSSINDEILRLSKNASTSSQADTNDQANSDEAKSATQMICANDTLLAAIASVASSSKEKCKLSDVALHLHSIAKKHSSVEVNTETCLSDSITSQRRRTMIESATATSNISINSPSITTASSGIGVEISGGSNGISSTTSRGEDDHATLGSESNTPPNRYKYFANFVESAILDLNQQSPTIARRLVQDIYASIAKHQALLAE